MENTVKQWWRSKTIIAGVVAAAIGGLQMYQEGADWMAIALAVFGALAVVLRTQTTTKLTK